MKGEKNVPPVDVSHNLIMRLGAGPHKVNEVGVPHLVHPVEVGHQICLVNTFETVRSTLEDLYSREASGRSAEV